MCILSSFTLAGIIIYMNIKNWENSPTVVTNVDIIDIRGKVDFPSIHICPQYADYGTMIQHLFNKYEKEGKFGSDYMDQVIEASHETAVVTHADFKFER